MQKMRTIAVIYGGYSSEADISAKSGKNVAKCLDRDLYDVYEVLLTKKSWSVQLDGCRYEIDKSDFSFTKGGKKTTFDKVFIIIHGDPGENGLLQGYFEMLDIPVAGCSSLVAAIAFDKYACKRYLRDAGIKMAKDVFLRSGDPYRSDEIVSVLGLPVFVKPNNGGSSFGVTKVKKVEDLDAAISDAFSQGDTLIIESAITGREIDCCVYKDGKGIHALPVIEIVSKNEYFDYEAKYLGASSEICPAPIPDALRDGIQETAMTIFRHLGCKGMVRMDFIASDQGVYFLEVNPNPGMTEASLVPQMVREAGMSVTDFLTLIIEE